jgi:hypothetical protein
LEGDSGPIVTQDPRVQHVSRANSEAVTNVAGRADLMEILQKPSLTRLTS